MTLPRLAFLAALVVLVAFVLPTTAHGDFFISNYNAKFIISDDWNFYHAVADEPTGVFSTTGLSGAPYGPLFYYPTAA